MALVFNEHGMDQLRQLPDFSGDIVVQEFVNHDGIIYKIYVIDSFMEVQLRQSIANVDLGAVKDNFMIFDSQHSLEE